MPERQAVESPFEGGVRPGVKPRKAGPSFRAPVKQQVGPSTAQYVVDSLLKFAGVAGSAYGKKVAKDIEADKAVQMSRAVQGIAPTDDSTKAGYAAHAAVGIQSETLGAQARLEQLAKTRVSDEAWDEAIKAEYKGMDKYLTNNYEYYEQNPELQVLQSAAMREMIPKVTLSREANKVGFEIEDRINTATDTLINSSKAQPGKDILPQTELMLSSLKLTESQKDKVLVDSALKSRSISLLKLTKEYKGQRDTSLFERTGQLQSLEKTLINEEISNRAIQIGLRSRTLDNRFLSGELTEAQYTKANIAENKLENNRFSTSAHVNSILDLKNKNASKDFKINDILTKIQDQTQTDLSEYKPEEVQAGFDSLVTNEGARIEAEADQIGLTGIERAKFIQDNKRQSTHYIADMATKSGHTIDAWTADMNNLANLNIPANILEADVGDFKVEQLSPTAQRAVEVMESMSTTAKDEFIDSLGSKESRTLRNFNNLMEMGMPLPQALDKAQRLTRNPSPINTKAISKGVEAVVSKQEFSWFKPDFKSVQDSYLENAIREKIQIDPQPDSDSNVKLVNEWMKKKWTLTGNLRLKGSPSQLSSLTGLHVEKLENAMEGYVNLHRATVLPQIQGLGLSMDDVFPVTDPKLGYVELHTRSGDVIAGTRKPLKVVKQFARKWKIEQEKASWKEVEDTKKRWSDYDPQKELK